MKGIDSQLENLIIETMEKLRKNYTVLELAEIDGGFIGDRPKEYYEGMLTAFLIAGGHLEEKKLSYEEINDNLRDIAAGATKFLIKKEEEFKL